MLELQLCTNVLSLELVHEMHEMSNHNKENVYKGLYGMCMFIVVVCVQEDLYQRGSSPPLTKLSEYV